MSRRSSEPQPRRAPVRLPGWAGTAASLLVVAWLLRWPQADVDAALAVVGLPADLGPGAFALVAGAVTGIVVWAVLYLMVGPGGWLVRKPRGSARRPLSYDDLGPPPPLEQPLPVDLNQPLSAFDPGAIGHQRR